MDLVRAEKETILKLADQSHQQCISIFIPTHVRGKEVNERQDQLAFKNHSQTIRRALEQQSLRSNDIDELMQPLESLLDNSPFWRHQREGLAVFRNPDYFAVFQSPLPLENSCHLDSSFRVRPLLTFAEPFPIYYVLQVGKDGVVLYQADPFSISQVDTGEVMPLGLSDITQYYDFEEELQGRTTGRGGMATRYTSDDLDNKEKGHLLADYFRLIDEGVIKLMGTRNVPLLLASVAYYQPIYQQINSYPYLRKEGLTGNFDHVQPRDIHRMANELLIDDFRQNRQLRIDQYQQHSGTSLVSRDLRQLLTAAVMGRIDVLFLQSEADVWGHFDEATLATTLHDERQPDDQSLLDRVALLTLRQGGEVYMVDDMTIVDPRGSGSVAALFRF
ncbi:baeRF7 domain-containing protein [Spirosoma sordidisoli]|uniref:Uncharacterized protein n=1 Tax=Spirosoma sordidisoli TaxID=2502893 RepID=A0A4Q2ULY6_9BACT|nr:hypothetical protein [Spirosoma sordidisoli]RYC67849.1 hypothetical protein EQG79_20495 [Spirosoma sordidisoli]